MTAQWNDQDNGATVLGPSQDLDAPIDSSARGGLLELDEIGFDIDVVLAHHTLSLSEASALCPGAVLELDRPIDGRHVSLTCNGRTFALGTLATLDERLAVVITECWGTRR